MTQHSLKQNFRGEGKWHKEKLCDLQSCYMTLEYPQSFDVSLSLVYIAFN